MKNKANIVIKHFWSQSKTIGMLTNPFTFDTLYSTKREKGYWLYSKLRYYKRFRNAFKNFVKGYEKSKRYLIRTFQPYR